VSDTALTVRQQALMPVMELEQAVSRHNYLVQLAGSVMVEGLHFGTIPGTAKPTLYKPGAEMLTTVFGLTPRFETIKEVEQWEGLEPFFYYWMRCRLYHRDQLVGEADGSCNSREARYRWRWVNEDDVSAALDKTKLQKRGGRISEFSFAVDKAETTGKYGKPEEYWQRFRDAIEAGTAAKVRKPTAKGAVYDAWEIDSTVYRVPNEDIYSQVNTILKMAEKRALVAAVLVTVNASEFFTQDMEDLIDVPANVTVINQPAQRKTPMDAKQATDDLFDGYQDQNYSPPPEDDIDAAAELAEAKREAEDLNTSRPGTYIISPDVKLIELDYMPDWLDTDKSRQWGRLFFEARQHLGYKNDYHAEGALKSVLGDDYQEQAYAAAWAVLVDHVRAKVGSKPTADSEAD